MSETRQTTTLRPCQHSVVMEDFERCYGAVKSRDARFDGWFFTAVTLHRDLLPAELPGEHPEA